MKYHPTFKQLPPEAIVQSDMLPENWASDDDERALRSMALDGKSKVKKVLIRPEGPAAHKTDSESVSDSSSSNMASRDSSSSSSNSSKSSSVSD